MSAVSKNGASHIDAEVLEIQKQLYEDQLIRQATFKKGSKYYPVSIEPFALEPDRLHTPMSVQDKSARKQWMSDQLLSEREPVAIPEWTRVNIFRRAYRKPYDALTNLLKPVLGQPGFPHSPLLIREFGMEDFEKRKVFLGDKLVTSGSSTS